MCSPPRATARRSRAVRPRASRRAAADCDGRGTWGGVGRKVSLCGDAGADPSLIEALLRTGLRALSVAPAAIEGQTGDRGGRSLGPGDERRRGRSATSVPQWRPIRRILRNVLDRRPSGTRQRLANALGKNRSFVSQISQSGLSRCRYRRRISRSFSRSAIFRRRKEGVSRSVHPRPSQSD